MTDPAVGYVFSLSFVSTGLGDRDALDADLRATLDGLDEPFVEHTEVEIVSGKKQP